MRRRLNYRGILEREDSIEKIQSAMQYRTDLEFDSRTSERSRWKMD